MNTLKTDLKHFTGSETFTRHARYHSFIYTEGVAYLAEKAGAYWLIDDILMYQSDQAIKDLQFQTWILAVHDEGGATLRVEDGDKNHIKSFDVAFTDFPLKEITLWLVDRTLLLPSEY